VRDAFYYTKRELVQIRRLISYLKTNEEARKLADITYLQAVDLINKTVSIISEIGDCECDIISENVITVDDKEIVIPKGLDYKTETNYQITKREKEVKTLMRLILDSDDAKLNQLAEDELKTLLELKDEYIFTLSCNPKSSSTKRFLAKSTNPEEFCQIARGIKSIVEIKKAEALESIKKIQSDFADGEEVGYLLDEVINILKRSNIELLKKVMDMDDTEFTDEDCLYTVFEAYGLEGGEE